MARRRRFPARGAAPAGGDNRSGRNPSRVASEAGPSLSLGREIAALRSIVRATPADLIHLHSSVAGLAGRLLIRGRIPTVFQPHGWSFQALEGPLRSVGTSWERLAARWADEILCVSDAEQRHGKSAGIRARWRVIKNGVDLEAYSEAGPEEHQLARERLGLPRDTPSRFALPGFRIQKGQDMLVEAWPAVREVVPDACLFLVGDGPEAERLRRRAGPGVTLVGHREDIPDWVAASDVVALPSRWEGMSLVMLEAMARGRSVVSTDVGGAREVIGESAGAVVDDGPRRFAEALIERLADPERAAREGQCGKNRGGFA